MSETPNHPPTRAWGYMRDGVFRMVPRLQFPDDIEPPFMHTFGSGVVVEIIEYPEHGDADDVW